MMTWRASCATPRFLSQTAAYDVASIIRQALPTPAIVSVESFM